MDHTKLTLRNYAGYASVILMLGTVAVGFGAVDLAMIAPLGLDHIAAVGQGELVIASIFAFLIGIVDVFGSRLAVAEGMKATSRQLPILVAALLLLLIPCQLLVLVLVRGISPVLSTFGQVQTLIPSMADYITVRLYGIIPAILYVAANEALKICGLKNYTVLITLFGFVINALLDWAFLYTFLADAFASPESAIAVSTVVAQMLMALCGATVFAVRMRRRPERFVRPGIRAIAAECTSMGRTAFGVGVRHLNDYAGSVVPLLFIGTRGVGVLAAAQVATKIYTIFCRIPQACFAGTFAFYGYAVGQGQSDLGAVIRKLAIYAAVPTIIATLAVLLFPSYLIVAFAGDGLDWRLARSLLEAYLLFIPAYFFEQFQGEILTVHQRGALLSAASTLTTYAMTIPLAWYAVFVVDSAFLAIATKGLSTAALACTFWLALRNRHSSEGRLRHV